jgi:uncharacterized protein (TIGR02246 family)
MRRIAMVAVCLAFFSSPALAQTKATIQKLEDQFGAAFAKGDAAALAAMYTSDAYVLPAGVPMVKGAAGIQAFWQGAMKQLQDVKCTALDVKPLSGNAAREIGTCTFKTKAQPPQDGALKYAVVWQRQDGGWKLLQDIWNFDK